MMETVTVMESGMVTVKQYYQMVRDMMENISKEKDMVTEHTYLIMELNILEII